MGGNDVKILYLETSSVYVGNVIRLEAVKWSRYKHKTYWQLQGHVETKEEVIMDGFYISKGKLYVWNMLTSTLKL